MSKDSASGKRGAQILIFGEDDHDRRAIAELIRGLRPDLRVKYVLAKKPLTLVRDMNADSAGKRNDKILATIRAANVRQKVHATILHEDADDVEPAHLALISKKEGALASAPGVVVAAVPAWEIETWWLSFPDAVRRHRATWNYLNKYVGRDVGKVRDSKEVLTRLLRPAASGGKRVPDYNEADSPSIARNAVATGELKEPKAVSDSWKVFADKILAIPPVSRA
ncbi:MAG: hypothetical protein QG622_3077 [Actinomycetota bacterium]|nr:hypothetical protein [Actinomycetota bacterium]